MPKIIYKQQHVGDNGRKFSASRNSHYVKYIGEREHVLKTSHETNLVKYIGEREHAARLIDKKVKKAENDNLITYDVQSKNQEKSKYDEDIDSASEEMFTEPENGLFGVINGKFSDSYSTIEMQKYVRKISTPHRNVFHSIFSFTPESAAEAGLNTLDDWENWVKYHISDIANGMNMKIENIEYLTAVHLKEGQPHVHIMWWDIQQQVLINKVDPLICDKIRIDAIRSTYRELFNEIYNKEEIMRRSMRKQIGEYTIQNVINGASDNYTSNIYAALYQIYRALPPKGQLKYKIINYTHPEVTQKLDELTHYIIDNNAIFKAQYDEICELRFMYNQLLHSEESVYGNFQITSYMKQVNDKVEYAVGNEILRIIKAEKMAGHFDEWQYTDVPNFDSITDEAEVHHDEAPPFFNDKPDSDQSIDRNPKPDPNNDLPHGEAPVLRKLYISSFAIREARNAVKDKDYDRALELFSKEADKGNILAKYEIADLCRRNLCQGNAFEIYREALNGFLEIEPTTKLKPYVQYRIGRMYYDGYGTERDLKEAFDWLKKSAEGGNYLAANTLAKMYKDGIGTEKNMDNAIQWYENAAKDNAYTSYTLGKIYFYGNGVRIDYREAEKHLLNAAKSGLNCAELLLGRIYSSDDENMQDLSKAQICFEKAAEQGNADAAYRLSVIYSKETDKLDDKKSQYWLSKAIELYTAKAEGGNGFAAFSLGRIYSDNTNDSVYNAVLAEKWLKAASESDDECSAQAEYILARLFMSDDVHRYADAVEWMTKSYNHGNNNAAFALAKILSDDNTKLQDYKAAHNWLEKAESGAEKILIEGLLRNSVEATIDNTKSWIDYAQNKLDLHCRFYSENGTDVTEVFIQQVQESRLSEAEYKLGMLFLREDNLNYDLAASHLRKASVLQNPYAMYTLAKLYLKGDIPNIPKEQAIAISLLENAKALDKGIVPFADYTLGAMYMFDDEVQDKDLAMKYLTSAANSGNQYAQQLLDNQTAWMQTQVVKLIGSIGRLLSQNVESSRAALQECSAAVFGRGDLSKEQIRELLLKMQDKENTAEM